MSSQSRHRRRWIPWQISLRTLLIVAIATGTLAGLFGHDIARAIREYPNPPPIPPIQIPRDTRNYEDKSNGYFESAETPLH